VWGLLALLVGYVLDPLLSVVVSVPDRRLGETVLTVLLLVPVLAGMVTPAALIRTRQGVQLFEPVCRINR
jgi:hypothetical protein